MAKAPLTTDGSAPVIRRADYPSNSFSAKERSEQGQKTAQQKEKRDPEDKQVQRITKGPVRVKKKTLGKKIFETFVKEDVVNVKEYMIYDMLIPAVKNFLFDGIIGGIKDTIEMSLFGTNSRVSGNRVVRGPGGQSYVQYQAIGNQKRTQDERRHSAANNRAVSNFGDIEFSSRGEAEEVLSQLVDFTADYGMASVADLYYSVGMASDYTDNKYGWTDLSSSYVDRSRTGYILRLPKPRPLD